MRIEQRRILEKKLDLRLQKLAQKGISKEKAQSDSLVKKLKADIRKTALRIATADKYVKRTQELAEAKAQKLAEAAKKEEQQNAAAAAGIPAEPKAKKKAAATTDAEAKPKQKAAKKPADTAEEESKKRSVKKKEEPKTE